VSAVIPVHNGERYLAEAIESALGQTVAPLEVIVVDDGSTDDCAGVAARYGFRVRYVRQPRAGAGAARNRGADLALGEYIAFLDADDLWVPDKLERQLAAFEAVPPPDAVFGHVEQFHSPDLDEETRSRVQCPEGAMAGYHPGAMLITREAFLRVGHFETSWGVGEFVDWYARAVEKGLRCAMLPGVVLRRRLHATNQGMTKRAEQADYARILKAALDRRRAARSGGRSAADES
jgi:glycosyltransferase involved in cell wall biosynthesis